MTNNTRSYLNNKAWYRLLKVVYIFCISIICIVTWIYIYNNSEYYNKEENQTTQSLADFITTTEEKWEISNQYIEEKFPEFKDKEQALADFIATIQAKPDLSPEELKTKFPEFYPTYYINRIKFIWTIIGKFLLIIWIAYLITELLKRTFYYVVLWSFNPKK